jgi:hypothetical protein
MLFLEKKLKINPEHAQLFSCCYCKAHVQFKGGIAENKTIENGKWGRG